MVKKCKMAALQKWSAAFAIPMEGEYPSKLTTTKWRFGYPHNFSKNFKPNIQN